MPVSSPRLLRLLARVVIAPFCAAILFWTIASAAQLIALSWNSKEITGHVVSLGDSEEGPWSVESSGGHLIQVVSPTASGYRIGQAVTLRVAASREGFMLDARSLMPVVLGLILGIWFLIILLKPERVLLGFTARGKTS